MGQFEYNKYYLHLIEYVTLQWYRLAVLLKLHKEQHHCL